MQYGNWNHINELLVFCYIKIHWSILNFKRVVCNIMHWSFGNIGLLNYTGLPNIVMFHGIVSKILLVHISTSLTRKVFKCEEDATGEYIFSKILIFAWGLEFYHCQQILSAIFLEVTHSVHFWGNVWQIFNILNNHS